MSQSDSAIATESLSRREEPLLNGVPFFALFGGYPLSLGRTWGRTMLKVAPSATCDGSIGFRDAPPEPDFTNALPARMPGTIYAAKMRARHRRRAR